MRTLGNVLWHFPFFGFITAILTYLLGLILVVTVVGAPIGLGLIEYGKYLFAPYSKVMISKSDLNIKPNPLWNAYSFIVRIVYFPIGLSLVVLVAIQAAAMFFSIVGIPVAIVLAKSIGTYFNPINKICVPRAVGLELERRNAQKEIDKYLN